MVSNKDFEIIKKQLVQTFNPQSIYIFGPYAWGHPDEDDDLDLLIVIDKADAPRHKLMSEGYRALMDVDGSKNILVYTKDEFEKNSEDISTLIYKIKRQGKQLYAKA